MLGESCTGDRLGENVGDVEAGVDLRDPDHLVLHPVSDVVKTDVNVPAVLWLLRSFSASAAAPVLYIDEEVHRQAQGSQLSDDILEVDHVLHCLSGGDVLSFTGAESDNWLFLGCPGHQVAVDVNRRTRIGLAVSAVGSPV